VPLAKAPKAPPGSGATTGLSGRQPGLHFRGSKRRPGCATRSTTSSWPGWRRGAGPAQEASRATLIRRLSLDLTGLPPRRTRWTTSSATRGQTPMSGVERLLQSPHYGERLGRHWLDAARYADSNGYNGDGARPMWRWRDWVIDALNRDVPFDQFTIEQIAGDLLPNATLSRRSPAGSTATPRRTRRAATTPSSTATSGGGPGQHDRDSVPGPDARLRPVPRPQVRPISQRDFFQLFAFFNNADEATLEIASPQEIAAGTPCGPG